MAVSYTHLHEIAEKYYPDGPVYIAGDSTNEYYFEKSFAVDNTVVSLSLIHIASEQRTAT